MAPAPRYPCHCCSRSFTKDFLTGEHDEHKLCLFCEVLQKVNSKTDEIKGALESVKREIRELKGSKEQDINETRAAELEKTPDVLLRVKELEEKIAGVENKMDESDCFKIVKKGGKIKPCAKDSNIVTSNAFQVLEDEVRDEPSLVLVGDSLIRHQDEEFCKQGPRRKTFCYPGKKDRRHC